MDRRVNRLQVCAKMAYKHAKAKQHDGTSPPTTLGVKGCLALMYDNIRRFGNTESEEELLDLAAISLFALGIAIGDWNNIKESANKNHTLDKEYYDDIPSQEEMLPEGMTIEEAKEIADHIPDSQEKTE